MLTGLETDGLLAPWLPSDANVLIYGDSITEGALTLGGSQHYDTDHNDASVVYSYALGRLLGAEVGVVKQHCIDNEHALECKVEKESFRFCKKSLAIVPVRGLGVGNALL